MLFNLAQKDAEFLAKKFGQLSFFFGKTANVVDTKDRHTASTLMYYATNDDGKTYELVEISDKINNEKDAEDFFSRHGDFKFSIDMDVFKESIQLKDKRSLDETLTLKGRAFYRGIKV